MSENTPAIDAETPPPTSEPESTATAAPETGPGICPQCKAATMRQPDGSIACVNCGIIKPK